MSVSKLASSILESPTLRLNEEAAKLRERGEAVIHLGAGEPKNKAPISAILSAAARLNTGDIKYTPTDGISSLKKAIVRYTEENYDKIVGPDNVIVSQGAKQANDTPAHQNPLGHLDHHLIKASPFLCRKRSILPHQIPIHVFLLENVL